MKKHTVPSPIESTEDLSQYPLEEMMRLRYKHNMSLEQIAKKMGCHKSNVHRKLERYLSLLPDAEEVEAYRKNKAEYLDALELKTYVAMLDDEKLKAASFNNLAYGYQNICTQNRLEKGLATEITDSFHINATLEDLQRREQELLKKIDVKILECGEHTPKTQAAVGNDEGEKARV